MQSPIITVFTPTFNRASHLIKLYDSLVNQSFPYYEWIIVDDGSNDDTAEVVARFRAENRVKVSYHFQQNSGKHIAINRGVELAAGELFFIVDSDDLLPKDALSVIHRHWQALLVDGDEERYAGLCGLRLDQDGTVIGGSVDYQVLDVSLLDYRYRMGYQGDKAEVFRTDILRAYPFPVIADEKFCTEALVWNRIGQKYWLRFFNAGIYTCEYLAGGLSANSFSLRKKSPRYACLYYSELLNTAGIPFSQRLRAATNFWRFALYNQKDDFIEKYRLANQPWSVLVLPVCYFLYCMTKLRAK